MLKSGVSIHRKPKTHPLNLKVPSNSVLLLERLAEPTHLGVYEISQSMH